MAKIESSVTTKLRGVLSTLNLSENDFIAEHKANAHHYRKVWDYIDLVTYVSTVNNMFHIMITSFNFQENSGFFIKTDIIITPNQTLGTCAENVDVEGAICTNNTSCKRTHFHLGHGMHFVVYYVLLLYLMILLRNPSG